MENYEIKRKTSKTSLENLEKLFKLCSHPNCGREFLGTNNKKYCSIHDTRYYASFRQNNEVKLARRLASLDNPNIKITTADHTQQSPYKAIFECQLPRCNETFEITIFTNRQYYPRYCTKHMNAYQRQRFLEKGSNNNGDF